jgi:hypothetical protein
MPVLGASLSLSAGCDVECRLPLVEECSGGHPACIALHLACVELSPCGPNQRRGGRERVANALGVPLAGNWSWLG